MNPGKVLILLASFCGFSQASRADVIDCVADANHVTYSMSQLTLKILDEQGKPVETIPNVSFQIRGPGQFELWDSGNQPLITLSLDNKGSDGNSDRIFPFTARWDDKAAAKHKIDQNSRDFGCKSNLTKIQGQD